MITPFRWIRLLTDIGLVSLLCFCALHHRTSVYLIRQAKGQLTVLSGTQPLSEYKNKQDLTEKERQNILLVDSIKKYSVDSLGYKATKNFSSVYDEKGTTLLWVITACEPYSFKPYEWEFPLVGRVSYKGFFEKELAIKEYNHLVVQGYDVDLRGVSAWSTLGWFNDPLLSSMLKRSKGYLCNLLFHELFHATYYAPSSVDFNENIASFIAEKATLRFLKNDTAALQHYLQSQMDNLVFNAFMLRRMTYLKQYYKEISSSHNRTVLKLKAIREVADSIKKLPLNHPEKFVKRTQDILKFKNAYFVGFLQYDSMQDSLEEVFNKIYRGNIEKMVQDLRLN